MLSAEDFVRESDQQADPWPLIAEDGALIDTALTWRLPMLNDLYTFSVPVFLRGHAVLSELLRKGEAHAAGYKITPSALLTARLFPDMFPLTGQVQAACDTAKRATAQLVGVEPPRFEDNEATFEELYARIQRTSEFVEKFQPDAFRDADTRKIELKTAAGVVSLTAEKYLTRFALPNFYFT
jgi:uncharacterized protein